MFNKVASHIRDKWRGYILAVVLVAIATALKFLAKPDIIPADVPILYIAAIVPTAFFYGLGPAIFACALSVLSFYLFFIAPYHSLAPHMVTLPLVVIFLGVGVMFSLLSARLRRKNERANKEIAARKQIESELIVYRDHLEDLVKVRTAALETANLDLERDIEKRKRVEEELTFQKNFNQGLIDTAPVIILIVDLQGRIEYFNPYMKEISGYRLEEVEDKDFYDVFFAEAARENMRKLFQPEAENTGVKGNVTPILTRDGEERDIEWYAKTLKDSKGTVIGLLAVGHDITERNKAEAAIAESEARYRSLFENSGECIFLYTTNGYDKTPVVFDANAAALNKLDYSKEEILGKPFDFFNPDMSTEMLAARMRALYNQGHVSFESSRKKKDGTPIEFNVNVSMIKNGAKSFFMSVEHDITQRKRLEEERRKIEKLESIGTLAGGIAHDFNNLLTGIMGNISLAKSYLEPEAKAFEILEDAEKASSRASDLTRQLLTFARGGAPVKTILTLPELIKDSATFVLHGSKVRPEFSIPDDLWTVEADGGQFSEVIHNLVKNANEAMPEGGTVRISANNLLVRDNKTLPLRKGRYIKISIEDCGMGIKKENLERMFEPFFTTKPNGSGLGLATSYSIIKNHGGSIIINSREGVGTTFYIFLPASNKQALKKQEAEAQSSNVGHGRILVMDDEAMIRQMLKNMLTPAGYDVELAGNGAEAIERYIQARETGNPFDAVILDLTVSGGMGGKETIKKLLKIDPGVKAIVSSGYATDPMMAEYKKYGFKSVVPKPYNAAEIKGTLFSLMQKKKKSSPVTAGKPS